MPSPERIDRYEILRKLATGGMAELFLAKQTGLEGFEKVVCIKRILAHLAQDEEFVSMFLDEARIAAKLSHPNIVQIYDLGRGDKTYYIAMEYVSGRNMASVVRKARETGIGLPIEHCCRVVAGVADGLFYAHTRKDFDGRPLNIIHRDISPQNILVSFSGGVKLVDFGIAKASTQIAQTRAGVLKGKYAYMSPEQVRGDKIDARSDIFAVGIVMYELMTGQRPFERETSLKTLKAIVQEKPLNPRELNPEVPIEVVRVLSQALEKNPDRRFPNAQELQLALEDYLDRSPRKSNNVRLSRYLYELFDDELNADGGTMVVKGIGEIIVPTGAAGDKAESAKVDEIPEGTVRAALDEIEARHGKDRSKVDVVTDEKQAPFSPPNTDQGEESTDLNLEDRRGEEPGGADAAAAEVEPGGADEILDDDDDDDEDEIGDIMTAEFDEDDIPDTVMQPPPERPPDHDLSARRARDEQSQTSLPYNADDEVDDDAGGGATLELDRADLEAQVALNAAQAAAEEIEAEELGPPPPVQDAQGDEGSGEEGDEEEIDNATLPHYDLASAGSENDEPADEPEPQEPAVEGDAAGALPPLSELDLPDVEEGETASLSPADVRRILDRVESLRQQASGDQEDAPGAGPATATESELPAVRPEQAAPADLPVSPEPEHGVGEEGDDDDDDDDDEDVLDQLDDAIDYGANSFDATVAADPPQMADRGGNGEAEAGPDDVTAAVDPSTLQSSRRPPSTPEDQDDTPPPSVAVSPQVAPPGSEDLDDLLENAATVAARGARSSEDIASGGGAGGIRITRRRAGEAPEISSHAAPAVVIEPAAPIAPMSPRTPAPSPANTVGLAEGQQLTPQTQPLSASDLASVSGHAQQYQPSAVPPPMESTEYVGERSGSRPAEVDLPGSSNAKLLLILAVLTAVAAGLGVLYVVLFYSPASAPTTHQAAGQGTIILKTDPPGAKIVLDTREQEGVTPMGIGGITLGEQHTLRFELQGYKVKKEFFQLTEDQRSREIIATLEKLEP